jgi:hypothetical protein
VDRSSSSSEKRLVGENRGVCVAESRERGAPRTNTRSWGWGFGQISDGLGNGYDGIEGFVRRHVKHSELHETC